MNLFGRHFYDGVPLLRTDENFALERRGTNSSRRSFPLRTGHRALDVLLGFVPVTFLLQYAFHAGAIWTFVVSALALVPLAAALGNATGELAATLGPTWAALLNATMGNATELIVGFLLLESGKIEIVKASLTGSILSNILLVFGLSAFVGGLGRERQTFPRRS